MCPRGNENLLGVNREAKPTTLGVSGARVKLEAHSLLKPWRMTSLLSKNRSIIAQLESWSLSTMRIHLPLVGLPAVRSATRKFARSRNNVRRAASLCAYVSNTYPNGRQRTTKIGNRAEANATNLSNRLLETRPAIPEPLLKTVARLRAFAIILCCNDELADKLTAVTLIRADVGMKLNGIDPRFTNWLVARFRDYYYNEYAGSSSRTQQMPNPPKLMGSELADILGALTELSVIEREALALTDAIGCSFREAAQICHCSTAELKSRLANAAARIG
jgi:RNA polymerase sigma-70 factor (ECF subfamily)